MLTGSQDLGLTTKALNKVHLSVSGVKWKVSTGIFKLYSLMCALSGGLMLSKGQGWKKQRDTLYLYWTPISWEQPCWLKRLHHFIMFALMWGNHTGHLIIVVPLCWNLTEHFIMFALQWGSWEGLYHIFLTLWATYGHVCSICLCDTCLCCKILWNTSTGEAYQFTTFPYLQLPVWSLVWWGTHHRSGANPRQNLLWRKSVLMIQ